MRQLIIQVPRGNGTAVIDIAKSHNGSNLSRFEGNADEPIDVVIVHVSNREVGLARLVESNVRFTRSNIEDQDTLLSVIYVQRQPEVTASSEEIRDRLTKSIQTQLLKQDFNVTPLVDVNVLETPATSN
jgi:uncharacterized membrane protein